MFDVLDEEGIPTGEVKARDLVHRDGDWHRSVHLWLFHGGDLLLQFRGPNQEANPLLWDVSCAGHLSAGETPEEGLEREFKEELGLDLEGQTCHSLGQLSSVWRADGITDREFSVIFLLKWKGDRPEIEFQKEEIEEVSWVPWKELRERVQNEDPSLVSHPEEFELLFKNLEGTEACENPSGV